MNRDLSPPSSVRPTHVRYGVLAFACTLSMITYLDRSSIGVAEKDIRDSLGLSSVADLTLALTAFNLAYALFEVPTGWLGDVFGPRKTLIRIVLWWSIFTALTGLTGYKIAGVTLVGFVGLIVVRFLFGIGEAGAYPNITRALHNWFPAHERGLTQGAVWFSGRLMGGLTALVWTLLVVWTGLSWRYAFWMFGGLGAVWCVLFAVWFRNRPEEKAGVNDAERTLIRAGDPHAADKAEAAVPWGRLFRSPTLWMLCLMYFCMSYGWYFNVNYLPAYLEQQHGVEKQSLLGALFKGGPLIFGAFGCLLGGYLTDRYIRATGDRRWGRRLLGMFGHSICVPCYLYCLIAPSAWTFALAIALSGFFNDLAMGSAWAACQDIGKKHAAIVAGCMNTIGNLGGAVATFLTGSILKHWQYVYEQAHALPLDALNAKDNAGLLKDALLPGYQVNFIIYAVLYAVTVFLWLGIDATRPVLPEDATDPGVRAG
jgi:MFS transporter, ACS family, glucarate transporter